MADGSGGSEPGLGPGAAGEGRTNGPGAEHSEPAEPSWIARGIRFSIGVALVVAVLWLGLAAARVLLLVLFGIILAAGLEPVVGWLRGRLGLRRGATILLVYGSFLVVVLGLALVVVPAALAQLVAAIERLPRFLETIRTWSEDLQPDALGGSIDRLVDAAERIVAPPPAASTPSTGQVVQVGLTLVEAAVTVVTLLVVVYYWLVEHARLQRYVLAFLPAERRAGARDTWNEVESRLGMWTRGQLILMGTIGLATGTACLVLGVPGALLLGLIAAITEAIPLVGPFLGAIPAVIVASSVSLELAVIVAAVYLVIQLIEANVLLPLVMRHSVGISPFVVLLSLLVGGAVGGVTGALLAVPLAAALELVAAGRQARERPVPQAPPPGVAEPTEMTDAADTPAPAPAPAVHPPAAEPTAEQQALRAAGGGMAPR